METTATTARELNIKVKNDIAAAKAAAKADMKKEIDHNIVTGKPLTSAKPKNNDKPTKGVREIVKPDKAAPKAPAAKVAKPKLSEKIDELIKKGGDWATLIAEAQEFCKVNELKSKITIGSFKTQVYWRTTVQKNPDYLTNLGMELTDKGISKVKKAAKK